MGVFCNVKPALAPRGLTAPNVVGKAGVLPKRLPLVVQDAPKAPTSYPKFTTLIKQTSAHLLSCCKLDSTLRVHKK